MIHLFNDTTTYCETNSSYGEEESSSDDDECTDEESDEGEVSSDDKEEINVEKKEEFDFAELIDKMIGGILNENTMKTMLSEVTKLQNYEVTDTEDIQEDNSTTEPEMTDKKEEENNKEDNKEEEKKEEITSVTDTDEFELIKSV